MTDQQVPTPFDGDKRTEIDVAEEAIGRLLPTPFDNLSEADSGQDQAADVPTPSEPPIADATQSTADRTELPRPSDDEAGG